MADTTLAVKDAAAATQNLRQRDEGAAGLVPYHVDADRAALLAAIASVLGSVDGLEALLSGTLAVSASALPLPAGAATQATAAAILAKLSSDPATQTTLEAIRSLLAGNVAVTGPLTGAQLGAAGLATQTTLAALLAKTIAAPSTEAKQDAGNAALGLLATQTTAAAILAKLSADPATQTTLSAVLAKLSGDPASQTTLEAVRVLLAADAKGEAIRALLAGTLAVSAAALPLPTGAATQATLAALLAKTSGDPATQTTLEAARALLAGGNSFGRLAPDFRLGQLLAFPASGQVVQTFVPGPRSTRLEVNADAACLYRQDYGPASAASRSGIIAIGTQTLDVLPGVPVTIIPVNAAAVANVYIVPRQPIESYPRPAITPVQPAGAPSVPAGLKQVMQCGSFCKATVTGYTRRETRCLAPFAIVAPDSIRVVYWLGSNAPQAGETRANVQMIVEAALELRLPSAMVQPFKFGGQLTKTYNPGDFPGIISDPLTPADFGLAAFPVQTSLATTPYIRTGYTVPTTAAVVPSWFDRFANGELTVSSNNASSQINATGALVSTGGVTSQTGLAPQAVVGTWAKGGSALSVGVSGDSIADGYLDTTDNGYNAGGGYMVQACRAANVAFMKMALGSDGFIGADKNDEGRVWLSQFVSDILDEHGTNDFNVNLSKATDIFRLMLAQYARFRAMGVRRITRLTLTPRAIGGTYLTKTGQAPTASGAQDGEMDKFRLMCAGAVGRAAGPDAFFGASALTVSDPTDPHYWGGTSAPTPDGVHLTPFGNTQATAPLATYLGTLEPV